MAAARFQRGFPEKAVSLFSLLLLYNALAAAQSHPFTSFDAPGATQGTFAYGVNGNGVITGFWGNGSTHGFVRGPNGSMTEFDAPNSTSTYATSINIHGQIVGYGADSPSQPKFHGFLRSQGGKFMVFDPPGATSTFPYSINDSGSIAGAYYDSNNAFHGFLRDASGNFTTVDLPGAGTDFNEGTTPVALNVNGEMTGYYVDASFTPHGFVRDSQGNLTSFDVGPGSNTSPSSITSAGTVTGYYVDASGNTQSFIRDPNGNITTFAVLGAGSTFARGINYAGNLCGVAFKRTNTSSKAFMRQVSGRVVPVAVPQPNQGSTATAINGNNRLIGYWTDSSGVTHGFVQ